MSKIKLYNGLYIDLIKLIASKLFIYANSGFGKSWLLRWLLEHTFKHIQQIVIDPEGEFSTLREKFDYLLIGKGKEFDIQADPRTAALLAHRLLEEKVSAIIDLFELEPLERERFVANFTTALVNAPKNLWHPYLYVVDEAQDFAPEKGDSLASKPLHSIAKKGRKRGCCPIFATQRVSDFSKAVIAACNNKLIGQASLDIDMKRCAAELGFTTKEQTLSLRDLEPGEFFAFGPAISKVVQKVKIGPVQTSHPDSSKMGSKIGTKVVPASDKVKKALAKLADLPQEAEREANTVNELRTQITTLKREISQIQKGSKPVLDKESLEESLKMALHKRDLEWEKVVGFWKRYATRVYKAIKKLTEEANDPSQIEDKPPFLLMTPSNVKIVKIDPKMQRAQTDDDYHFRVRMTGNSETGIRHEILPEDTSLLSNPEKRVLNAIAWMNSIGVSEPEKTAVAFLADYVVGGAFNNACGSLRSKGLIQYQGSKIVLTDQGRQFAETPEGSLTSEEMHRKVMDRLDGPGRKLMEVLIREYPEEISNEDLAAATGYQVGGAFNNAKGRLRTLGLAEYPRPNFTKASSILFYD